jgi:hypothetical protein
MIQQIKSGIKTDPQHNLEAIEYYFRPNVLLYDAKLLEIRVKAYYLAFNYIMWLSGLNSKGLQSVRLFGIIKETYVREM